MKGIYAKLLSLVLVGMVMLTLSSCGKEVSVEGINKKGKLVLGTSADYAPYEFHKEIDGKDTIVGFDIDIAKAIAEDLGVELEIKDMSFDGLLEALVTGKIDFIIAGMTPTPERAENVDFSKIYYTAVNNILINKENMDKISNLEDLKGKKIGVQKGSVQEALVTEQIKEAELKSLGKITDLILELKYGKVDAIVIENPVAEAYVEKNQELMITDINLDVNSEEIGSAVAASKGNEELIEAINKTIDKLIEEGKIDEFIVNANSLLEE
ncbi:ABC transporter substrate-binding protein [Oceanirhabdus seepicola]|uniref:Transporter substrate-binding domain-containing protein n=1 Tax=Oceanirhabdus seepicola TaxID=2828781 RepID=A0A9J6P4U9_9CLOT|nr:ABC transporter substrate-binding protein [Oceanirhabdus seepicola]MCM1991252.1 transporter substrate-binding domain-containing protein [Oceanirhabdus seepicola]